jgi:hypothetical protein
MEPDRYNVGRDTEAKGESVNHRGRPPNETLRDRSLAFHPSQVRRTPSVASPEPNHPA